MRLRRVRRVVFACAAVLLVSGPLAGADVIYRETFGHNSATDLQPTAFNWSVHSSQGGIWRIGGPTSHANINATGGTTFMGITGANSRPYDLLNTPNAGEPTVFQFDTNGDTVPDSNPRGVAYISGTAWGTTSEERRALYWTPEAAVNPADYVPGSLVFSWYQGNQNALDSLQLAIRVGSQWYVTTERIFNASVTLATFASAAELKQFTFTRSAGTWSLLNFNGNYDTGLAQGTDSAPEVGLSVGAPLTADLPAGSITGFGMYSHDPQTSGAGNRRFDTFTVEGTPIPEPGTASISTAACALLLLRRRRLTA